MAAVINLASLTGLAALGCIRIFVLVHLVNDSWSS